MRIRLNFVSNSSSSSYVVALPEWKVAEPLIRKFITDEGWDVEEGMLRIRKLYDLLCKKGFASDEDAHDSIAITIPLEKHLLFEADTGHGVTAIFNVNHPKVRELLNNLPPIVIVPQKKGEKV